MPLLRASDFCRPCVGGGGGALSPHRHEVQLEVFQPSEWQHPQDEDAQRSDASSFFYDGSPSDEVCGEGGGRNDVRQESLAVFAPLELLQKLHLIAGTIVFVERDHGRGGAGRRRVPARLRLLPILSLAPEIPSSLRPPVLRDDESDNDDNEGDRPYVQPSVHDVVHVSPMVAANLGLYSGGPAARRRGVLTPCTFTGGGRRRLPRALTASLAVWGTPTAPGFRWREKSHGSGSGDPGPSLSSCFPSPASVPLPPAGSILSPGSIVSVLSKGGSVYFLEVLRVQTESPMEPSRDEGSTDALAFALGTVKTRYKFPDKTVSEAQPLGPFHLQLPPFHEASLFLRPTCCSHSVPHPDIPRLVEQFRRAERARSAVESVLAVTGSDYDHHATVALHQAAESSGRRSVDAGHSWVAFGYLHAMTLSSSGSLVDKLRGLELALKVAKQHAPSVVILRLDNELSRDKHERHDQEGRVWSLLSQLHEQNSESNEGAALWKGAGSVVVVLVVENPLDADGPLSQRIVIPPFALSRPDDSYIRHLWSHSGVLDQGGLESVRGRPAQEVVTLFRKVHVEFNDRADSGESDLVNVLRSCCREVDQEHRIQSHAQSRIPSVYWEDIGGLGHVRREILDAIELPLRYPHLLPNGNECSRSGMLLWGPPGTGKTLVAKAVATECNLPFVSVRGPELMGSYVGESEENVRNVFASARRLAAENQPPASVLFFDEIDSLAPRRGGHASGGNVTDRIVATLLAELERKFEGFTVFCMGATNRPDLLDPSLLRPGRLDRLVYLGVDPNSHTSIIRAQIRRLNLEVDAECASFVIAQSLPRNATGADLSTIASSALLRATRRICAEADEELTRRQSQGEAVSLEHVLDSWDESRLRPLVQLDDLLESAKYVTASVDESELQRYASLRDEFLTVDVGSHQEVLSSS